jgi:type IV secretion system protein VirB8
MRRARPALRGEAAANQPLTGHRNARERHRQRGGGGAVSPDKGDSALADYFREAARWDLDRVDAARRSERRAWRLAAAGWMSAIAGAVAVLSLTPLKRVEPFVIRVDNATGVVDVVPIYTGTARMEESVTRYFLSHYVSTCERFNRFTAETDYEECGAFNTAARNQAWYALWQTGNPGSPLNLHRDGSSVRALVQAVSFLARANGQPDSAQVRYQKLEQAAAGSASQSTAWIATIEYTYVTPSSDPRVRRWNPLGFKVLEFTSEPEANIEVSSGPAARAQAP